jgi:hypothetical protein
MLYEQYKEQSAAAAQVDTVEAAICELLVNAKVRKIRFEDGEVYEVKYYKSPREHFALKRSKV